MPREFQPREETFDESFHFVGPVLGSRLDERVDDHTGLRAAVERVAASGTIRQNLDRMRAAIDGGGAKKAADVILSRAPRAV